MPYPTVNLEGAAPPVPPKDASATPSPIVAFRALRRAYTHETAKCVRCGAACETFADAEHADGSVTGWVAACEACVKAASAPTPPAAPVASPSVSTPSPTPVSTPSPATAAVPPAPSAEPSPAK